MGTEANATSGLSTPFEVVRSIAFGQLVNPVVLAGPNEAAFYGATRISLSDVDTHQLIKIRNNSEDGWTFVHVDDIIAVQLTDVGEALSPTA
jgi:hypothetical protein